MFPNLKEINDLKNVKNTLLSCAAEETSFFIWIKEGEDRIKSKAIISDITFNEKVLGTFNDEIITVDKQGMDVFLYQEDKKILFKGVIEDVDAGKISVSIVPKIFMQEKRKRGRFYFKKIDVVVKMQVKDIDGGKSFYANLSDISEKGMCFEVLLSRELKFQIKSEVNLINIEGIKFPEMIKGNIIHLTQFKDTKGEHLQKVGVKFDQSNPIVAEVMLVMGNTKRT